MNVYETLGKMEADPRRLTGWGLKVSSGCAWELKPLCGPGKAANLPDDGKVLQIGLVNRCCGYRGPAQGVCCPCHQVYIN